MGESKEEKVLDEGMLEMGKMRECGWGRGEGEGGGGGVKDFGECFGEGKGDVGVLNMVVEMEEGRGDVDVDFMGVGREE